MKCTVRASLRALLLVALPILDSTGQGLPGPRTFFPDDPHAKPHVTFEPDEGPSGTFYIDNANEPQNPCFYKLVLPANKLVESWGTYRIKPDANSPPLDVVYYANGSLGFKKNTAFFFEPHNCPDNPSLSRSTAVAAPTPTPTPINIPVSNDGDAFAVSCDGAFAVVVGANSMTPVSLVDLTTDSEVDTLSFDGLSQSVAICDDGVSVLVHLDTNSGGASQIRRLTVANGMLTNTGESLALGSATVTILKVFAVPGSKTGLLLLTETGAPTTSRLVSFKIPGLQVLDSVTLAGRLGNGAAVSCNGDRVFVRSGNRAIDPDVIQAFTYDPGTGLFTEPASLTINGVSGFTGSVFNNSLALTPPDDAFIVASEAIAVTDAPTPRVTLFNSTTGVRSAFFPFNNPVGVTTFTCCNLAAVPTPTPSATPTPTPSPSPSPTPTVSPTPSTTPTPTPTPTPVPTQAQGSGTIAVTGGQGSFNFSVAQKVGRKKPKQSFTYSDPIAGINFSVKKISGLTINSHHTQFTGTAKLGRKNKPTFTVDVDDLGPMGMNDQFSIQLSTGYSAGGVLTSGDITVH